MLTQTQLKKIVIIPRVTGGFSTIGSSLIMYMILSEKQKLKRTYYRLMLGISIFDFISSVAYLFGTMMLPKGSTWLATGNDNTCTMQGAMFQIGLGVMYYNSALMLYYLLRIRYGFSEDWIKNSVEIWMHFVSLFIILASTVTGLSLRVYNQVGTICFAGDYPRGCTKNSKVECQRGEHYYPFFWVSSGVPMITSVAWLCISLLMILSTVAKTRNTMKRYDSTRSSTQDQSKRKTLADKVTQIFTSSSQKSSSTNSISIEVVEIKRTRRKNRKGDLSREARLQAIRYVLAYITCFIWPLIIRALVGTKTEIPFALFILGNFFGPLQGLLNYLNFVWPRAQRLRRRNDANTFLHAIFLSTFIKESVLKRRSLQARVQQSHMRRSKA